MILRAAHPPDETLVLLVTGLTRNKLELCNEYKIFKLEKRLWYCDFSVIIKNVLNYDSVSKGIGQSWHSRIQLHSHKQGFLLLCASTSPFAVWSTHTALKRKTFISQLCFQIKCTCMETRSPRPLRNAPKCSKYLLPLFCLTVILFP